MTLTDPTPIFFFRYQFAASQLVACSIVMHQNAIRFASSEEDNSTFFDQTESTPQLDLFPTGKHFFKLYIALNNGPLPQFIQQEPAKKLAGCLFKHRPATKRKDCVDNEAWLIQAIDRELKANILLIWSVSILISSSRNKILVL